MCVIFCVVIVVRTRYGIQSNWDMRSKYEYAKKNYSVELFSFYSHWIEHTLIFIVVFADQLTPNTNPAGNFEESRKEWKRMNDLCDQWSPVQPRIELRETLFPIWRKCVVIKVIQWDKKTNLSHWINSHR